MVSAANNENITTTGILVSIVIIGYNSSSYILETLESAKAQTYANIELIVCDDCSTDNTVEICKNWININKERFMRVELIAATVNGGIPANCNRGVKASKGEWIKLIAGDDILDINCITSFVYFIRNNSEAKIIESASQFFKNSFRNENFLHIQNLGNNLFYNKATTACQQYSMLLRRNYIHSPSVLLNKEAIVEVGLFDEKFKFMEDHPMWLKLTKAGFKIYFVDKITVYYRIHESSVFASFSNTKLFSDFYLRRRNFDIDYIYPNISMCERVLLNIEFHRKKIIDKIGMNKNYFLYKVLNTGSYKIIPSRWIVNRHLHKIEKQILTKL